MVPLILVLALKTGLDFVSAEVLQSYGVWPPGHVKVHKGWLYLKTNTDGILVFDLESGRNVRTLKSPLTGFNITEFGLDGDLIYFSLIGEKGHRVAKVSLVSNETLETDKGYFSCYSEQHEGVFGYSIADESNKTYQPLVSAPFQADSFFGKPPGFLF